MVDLMEQIGFTRHPCGLWVPGSPIEMPIGNRRPIAVDLFCGCGGMSLGFLQAGWEIVAAVDNWPEALITYAVNLGSYPVNFHFIEPEDEERMNDCAEHLISRDKETGLWIMPVSGSGRPEDADWPPVRNIWCGDIRKLKGQDILDVLGLEPGDIDCVCGGPPCQGFSIAGRRDVMDPRNSLVFEFARLVLELRPKTMLMENVPGLLNMVTPEGLPVIDEFCLMLEKGGFSTREALKRSLLATSGAGAAVRRGGSEGKSEKKKETRSKRPIQGGLWG